MPFARISGLLRRLLLGEDVLLVRQTKEQWDRQFAAGTWNRLQEGQPNTDELARLISDYARTKGGSIRVLDVGCGNGGLARLLTAESSIAYTGIDISETALAAARMAAPHTHFIAADAEQPPPDMETFDVLVFNEVLYYMNPDRVLPRYRIYATADARVFISMLRFWRTPFVFHRIRRHLRIDTRFRVSDRSHQWDIATGCFL
jgi:SAM-dependent methyltransferase